MKGWEEISAFAEIEYMNYNIAIIPGDGIGPEVTAQAKKALDAVADM